MTPDTVATDLLSAAGPTITSETAIRSTVGATLDIANTYLEGKVEGRKISPQEYLFSAARGAIGGNIRGLPVIQGLYAGATDAAGQYLFAPHHRIDLMSVAISAVSAVGVSKLFRAPAIASTPELYNSIAEQVVGFTVETPAQIINLGIQRAQKHKQGP